jgi:hypothetical protein
MAALGYQVSQADNDFVRKIVWSSASSSTYLNLPKPTYRTVPYVYSV